MRAGKLRWRVTIEQATPSKDAAGESILTWSTLTTVWGDVTPLIAQARESFAQASSQIQSRAPMQVRIRYRTGLSPATHRLRWDNGRLIELENVLDPDGRKRELVLMGYEVQQ